MPGPHGKPGMAPEKAKDFKGTLRKLLAYLGKYRIAVLAVLLFAVASTVFSVIGPKILSTATTELATGLGRKLSGLGGIDFGKIGKILLTVLALYLVSAACSFFSATNISSVVTPAPTAASVMARSGACKINHKMLIITLNTI